jgi:hypothetical protein
MIWTRVGLHFCHQRPQLRNPFSRSPSLLSSKHLLPLLNRFPLYLHHLPLGVDRPAAPAWFGCLGCMSIVVPCTTHGPALAITSHRLPPPLGHSGLPTLTTATIMNINKKFDRLKQWTNERLGAEARTGLSDEFKALEVEMQLRHEGMHELEPCSCCTPKC